MTQDELLQLIDQAATEGWTELDLSGQGLTELPPEIGKLTQLETLILGKVTKWEYPDGRPTPQLSTNDLTKLPKEIANLTQLKEINLSGNPLGELPTWLPQLQSLEKLWAIAINLTTIPDCIGQLSHLTHLGLSSNQITTIPNRIGQLSNLKQLNLSSNQISAIPNFLESLATLENLDMRRNPLPISPEILGPLELYEDPGSVEGIFSYLRQLRSDSVRPLNEAKMLLVGQDGVGKTSLINQLMEDTFNPNEPRTDGLTVREWGVHINSKDVRLHVWEFGGQEIYYATHQFFLTKRSLYILVCNCRTSEEENRIEYWLKLIQSFGGESPVIIVGNKSDEQPLDINRKALRAKYPNICAILETSCRSGQGIDELRAIITAEVGKLREVYNLLPLSWFQVKEQIEALDKDFISYNEYIGICYQNNIPEEHNQTQLIELLHNLGLVLNFRNHPFLQNTNVLNPGWVTTGIYTLLSDDTLKTQGKGILEAADLSRVLDPGRYPAERHRYLTELMQEFQLCFELPDCPSPRFLIPGLLPKAEPEDTHLEGDTLEFQYHYRILPESVLSRFIVLSHDKIHNHIHWRSGVMLAYREGDEVYNIACIKADPEDKKIFIAIAGRETTRRVFLSLIRDTFTRIHRSFADLEVSEWVPVPGHPDHPPLDYQELLALEAMGEGSIPIGKLRLRISIRQVLDGYSSVEVRNSDLPNQENSLEIKIFSAKDDLLE